jgi:hypothetical protein
MHDVCTSPVESATAPVPHQRANLELGREPGRITDLDDEGGGVDRSDPGLVAQRCAVLVEEAVDVVLESVDL